MSAISDFVDQLNPAINSLLSVREDVAAFDRLSGQMTPAVRASVRTFIQANFAAAQAQVAALVTPGG